MTIKNTVILSSASAIQAVNQKLDEKIPYTRRNVKRNARIRTAIREEPYKLAQYVRGGVFSFKPFFKKNGEVRVYAG